MVRNFIPVVLAAIMTFSTPFISLQGGPFYGNPDYCAPSISEEAARTVDSPTSNDFEAIPGEKFADIQQGQNKARVQIMGVGMHGIIGTQVPIGAFLALCVQVTNLGDVDFVHGSIYGVVQSELSEVRQIHKVATAVANSIPEEEALRSFNPSAVHAFPTPSLGYMETLYYVLVFDIDPEDPAIFLSESLTDATHDNEAQWGITVRTSQDQVNAAIAQKGDLPPSESSQAAQQPVPEYGQITSFGVDTLIHVGMPKYWLNFDQNVEVRSQIGGVYPQNGQFLVIWFDQQSQDGTPLKLGNFQLVASAGQDGQGRLTSLSNPGTEALILTEYFWTPNQMDSSTRYRTGIAFDIAPEETHFVLEYDLGTSNEPWGPSKPVQIEFDA